MAAGAAGGARPLSAPPAVVLDAFGVDDPRRMAGGQGEAHRAGDLVLKPVLDVVEADWLAGVLDALPARDDLRIIRPAPARDGRWVVDGWSAWHWLAGHTVEATTAERLDVTRRFHDAVRDVAWSPAIATSHPWGRGHAWAWDEVELDVPPTFDAVVAQLREVVASSDADDEPSQLIHGDMAGNVLVADGLPPAVIDVSPSWRPARYAEAIVAVDVVGWFGAPVDDVALVPPHLAARAALFRLGSAAVLCADDPKRLAGELSAYGRIAERLRRPAR